MSMKTHNYFKHFPTNAGDIVNHTGEQEIPSVSGRVGIDVLFQRR